jgi:acetyl-CoA acyltransferase 2
MSKDVFILGGKRTPMGEYVGVLKDISAIDLGAVAARGALEATGVALMKSITPSSATHCKLPATQSTARVTSHLKAGVPFDRPALTVNRLVRQRHSIDRFRRAHDSTRRSANVSGRRHGIDVAGAARHSRRAIGFALGQGKLEDSLMVALLDTYCNTPMAGTAENLARKFEISREEQDKYALRSQQEAKRAKDAGFFAEEIVPVEVKNAQRKLLRLRDDDHPRPETTLEILANSKPAFAHDGFVTAGNASGIVDGAAAL